MNLISHLAMRLIVSNIPLKIQFQSKVDSKKWKPCSVIIHPLVLFLRCIVANGIHNYYWIETQTSKCSRFMKTLDTQLYAFSAQQHNTEHLTCTMVGSPESYLKNNSRLLSSLGLWPYQNKFQQLVLFYTAIFFLVTQGFLQVHIRFFALRIFYIIEESVDFYDKQHWRSV